MQLGPKQRFMLKHIKKLVYLITAKGKIDVTILSSILQVDLEFGTIIELITCLIVSSRDDGVIEYFSPAPFYNLAILGTLNASILPISRQPRSVAPV